MNSPRFTPEFKEEAVCQIIDRGYSVAKVSERLGVSAHSINYFSSSLWPVECTELVAIWVAHIG